MIPNHLTSSCGELCMGCAESVKQNAATGRWFITMGHCGFNTPKNNGEGYVTELAAKRVTGKYAAEAQVRAEAAVAIKAAAKQRGDWEIPDILASWAKL